MKQCLLRRLTPFGLAFGVALGSAGSALAADWHATRTYSYAAPVYDDAPGPLVGVAVEGPVYGYGPVIETRRVDDYVAPAPVVRRRGYGYAPVVERRRIYNYVAPAPVVGPPAYGYGPVYGYVASEMVIVERENRPLGVYAPATRERLSESRRYFRAITRQSGGN